jgi:membrane-associated protein
MIELISGLIDFILHIDQHLQEIIGRYGTLTYLILFLIVFCETGLVIMPLLPGDSLLFAAGTFAALGSLNPWLLILLLCVAAIAGDTVNYWIGRWVGPRAFDGRIRWLRQDYLRRTEEFYQRHGGKTIVLARFVPIIRTFAPFVAGVGRMDYGKFIAYNVGGGILWVTLFTLGGYLFGNLPVVRDNFSLVVLAIIAVSMIPLVTEWIKARKRAAGAGTPAA